MRRFVDKPLQPEAPKVSSCLGSRKFNHNVKNSRRWSFLIYSSFPNYKQKTLESCTRATLTFFFYSLWYFFIYNNIDTACPLKENHMIVFINNFAIFALHATAAAEFTCLTEQRAFWLWYLIHRCQIIVCLRRPVFYTSDSLIFFLLGVWLFIILAIFPFNVYSLYLPSWQFSVI